MQAKADVQSLLVSLQAIAAMLEHHARQFSAEVKETLDPKKLSAGVGDAANPPDGSRSGHGHATTKWQVNVLPFLRREKQLISHP